MFEDLIPIFIFLIFILPSILKRIKSSKTAKAPKTAEAKKPSALSEILRQLKGQLEQAIEVKTGTPVPREMQPPQALEDETPEYEEAEEEAYAPEEIVLPPPTPEKRFIKRRFAHEFGPDAIQQRPRRRRRRQKGFTLKQAIIWREILGPPVALRSREDEINR